MGLLVVSGEHHAARVAQAHGATPLPSWMALQTRARHEKAVVELLMASSVEHYLPLVDRVSWSGRRKFVSQVPLFPGYVFLKGELDDAYAAIRSKKACRIVTVKNQDRFIREMDQIRRALDLGAELELFPSIPIGTHCRVRSGPLLGLEGTVVELGKHARFVLHVDMLGQGALVEVDRDFLEVLE